MKLILGGVFLLLGTLLYAEPPLEEYHNYTKNPHPTHQDSSVNTVVDDVIDIILAQGFSGAIIIILFGWLYRSDKTNRESQQANIDRFSELSVESNKTLSELVAKIDGVERELEAAKTLQMLTNRKG